MDWRSRSAQSLTIARRFHFGKLSGAAPLNWREPLGELAAELEAAGEEACVYGSLAWQYWSASSGMAYLTASSDVDLLFRPMSWSAVLKIVSVLECFERQHHAPRPDGEIVLPDGDAIAWREISNHPPKVLAKGMNRREAQGHGQRSQCF